MNIALIAHDAKKELMVQFCIAYCGILSRHNLCATGTTGKMVAEATGLSIVRFMSGSQGGDQQIASRISCNEIDLLLFFRDPIAQNPPNRTKQTCCACVMCTTSPWPPILLPPKRSSMPWSMEIWIGGILSIPNKHGFRHGAGNALNDFFTG